MPTPNISIAAVTYRNLEQTRTFIETVYECTKEPFELILVDNNSPIEVAQYLDKMAASNSNFVLIRNTANLGIGIGMNQAMRKCQTDYIFRCDTDIEIQTAYWTQFMKELVNKYPEIGAVGTAITRGQEISRPGYTELDICLSNCMLIPRRTLVAIERKMKDEYARVAAVIADKLLVADDRYDGYFKHLGGMLNYIRRHGGYWDINFPYGADDFHYSMLIRHSGLKITRDDRIRIIHHDASHVGSTPDTDRHRKVSEGFQYWRTFWEVMLDFYDIKSLSWDCFPMNKKFCEAPGGNDVHK